MQNAAAQERKESRREEENEWRNQKQRTSKRVCVEESSLRYSSESIPFVEEARHNVTRSKQKTLWRARSKVLSALGFPL